jgi:hypothetical protein
MPKRNVLLGLIQHIGQPGAPFEPQNSDTGVPADPADKRAAVRIGTSTPWRMAYLEPEDERYQFWRSVLTGLQNSSTPVFAEVEPDTRQLTDLLLPIVTRVMSVRRVDDGVWEVDLDRSATRHMAYEDGEDAVAVLKELQRFAGTDEDVLVTADRERNRIIDVSPLPPDILSDRGEPAVLINRSLLALLGVVSEIDGDDLDGFYAGLHTEKCNLAAVNDPCLPVQWADDFCFAMADHMCEKLAALGFEAGKVWLHNGLSGGLKMASRNYPSCAYPWRYHVAAFLLRSGESGEDAVRVIDPAACLDGPLTLQQWRDKVSGNEETPDFTKRAVFEQASPGNFTFRPSLQSTTRRIEKMRTGLRLRLRKYHGAAPPFTSCPADVPCP